MVLLVAGLFGFPLQRNSACGFVSEDEMSCSGFTLEEQVPRDQPSLSLGAVVQHLKRNELEGGETWAALDEAVTKCCCSHLGTYRRILMAGL